MTTGIFVHRDFCHSAFCPRKFTFQDLSGFCPSETLLIRNGIPGHLAVADRHLTDGTSGRRIIPCFDYFWSFSIIFDQFWKKYRLSNVHLPNIPEPHLNILIEFHRFGILCFGNFVHRNIAHQLIHGENWSSGFSHIGNFVETFRSLTLTYNWCGQLLIVLLVWAEAHWWPHILHSTKSSRDMELSL